jgi:allantoicase
MSTFVCHCFKIRVRIEKRVHFNSERLVNYRHFKIAVTPDLKITRVRKVYGQMLDAKLRRIHVSWSPRQAIKKAAVNAKLRTLQ